MQRTSGTRRTICQDWDEYFMTLAFLSAKLSRNPYVQVGACIVNNNNELVGIGYNGMLRECDDNKFYWYRGPTDYLSLQPLYVPHAEINALRNRNLGDVKNCTMYVTLFPCNKCAEEIIESGIKTVIYMSNKNAYKTINAKMMFKNADVTYRPMNKKIEIYFSDWNETNQLPQTPIREDQMEEDEVGNTIHNILFDPNYFMF